MIVGHPFDKLKRSTADHSTGFAFLPVVEAILLRRGGRVDHETGPIARHHVEEKSVGALHVHPYRQRIDHLNAVDRLIKPPHPRFGGRVHQAVDTEFNSVRIELGIVVEIDIVVQFKSIGHAIGRDLPRRCRIPHEITVRGDVDQTAADVHRHHNQLVARGGVEIQMRDFVAIGYPQNTTAFGLVGQHRADDPDEQSRDHQNRDEPLPSMHSFLLLRRILNWGTVMPCRELSVAIAESSSAS